MNFSDQCSILVMETQEHEHSAQIKCDSPEDSVSLKRHAPETAESTPAKRVRYVPKVPCFVNRNLTMNNIGQI